MRMTTALLLGALALAASGAERTGPFAGVGYGIGAFEDDGWWSDAGYDSHHGGSHAMGRLYAGAYINSNLSVEIDYTDMGTFIGYNASETKLQESFSAVGIAAVAHYPVYHDRIDLYAKFGAAEMKWEEATPGMKRSDRAGALVYGVGSGYRISDAWMLRAGYERYDFERTDGARTYEWAIDYLYGAVEVAF